MPFSILKSENFLTFSVSAVTSSKISALNLLIGTATDRERLGVPGLDPLGVLDPVGVFEPEAVGVLDSWPGGVLVPGAAVKPGGDVAHAGILGVVGLDDMYDIFGRVRALAGGDGMVASPALIGGSE